MEEEVKDELTYKIIGCAMKVHSVLGNACLPVGRVSRKLYIKGR